MKLDKISAIILILIFSVFLTGCEFFNNTPTEIENPSGEEEIPYEVSNDLFSEYYRKADARLKKMSLKEKVGQMFLAIYPTKYDDASKQTTTLYPGGFLFLGDSVKEQTKTSLSKSIEFVQKKSKTPMFIATEEEGGSINRLSSNKQFRSTAFKSPLELYEKGKMEAVLSDLSEKIEFIKTFGFNMNLAPVVDVPTAKKSYIYKRSFGTDKEVTAQYAEEVVKAYNAESIVSCLKHFPGYGDTGEIGKTIPTDKRKLEAFVSGDFLPFSAGINADAPAIMVSHKIVTAFDADNPASLSKKVHEVLREDLGFTGLIISDDVTVNAISKNAKQYSPAVSAILAGNDMIITSTLETHIDEVMKAIENKTLDEELINTAAKRILAAKYYYGIIKD